MQLENVKIVNLWSICRKGTRALGPGLRYALWTQGCQKKCRGCISPESQPIKPNYVISVEDLTKDILANSRLQGITVSGGEPFLQAAPLACLLKEVKRVRPDMTSIVFTGYQKEELVWPEAKALLSQTDVLIDGPYRQEQYSPKGLRGSTNQHFYFLTDALKCFKEELENGPRNQEIYITEEEIITIGIPNNINN